MYMKNKFTCKIKRKYIQMAAGIASLAVQNMEMHRFSTSSIMKMVIRGFLLFQLM